MTSELRVVVGRVTTPPTTHPLVASLYVDDHCVSQLVNFRDMRQVRSYYNGVLAGLTMTHDVRHGDTVMLYTVGTFSRARIPAVIPVNPEYTVADGIDMMTDELV